MRMETPIAHSDKIESFGLVDGPGVRSILFLSGCPFRCLYCHNPELQDPNKGLPLTPEEAFDKLMRFRRYWGPDGGITVSGGEPLLSLDFLIELGKLAKKEGVSYVIDTSGAPFRTTPEYLRKFDGLLEVADLFLLDLKGYDPALHKKMTGSDNRNVLSLFEYLNAREFPIWVRYVLVPGYTDGERDLLEAGRFLKTLGNVRRLEVLPYHALALPKYDELKRPYPLREVLPPTKEEVTRAKRLLEADSFDGYRKE